MEGLVRGVGSSSWQVASSLLGVWTETLRPFPWIPWANHISEIWCPWAVSRIHVLLESLIQYDEELQATSNDCIRTWIWFVRWIITERGAVITVPYYHCIHHQSGQQQWPSLYLTSFWTKLFWFQQIQWEQASTLTFTTPKKRGEQCLIISLCSSHPFNCRRISFSPITGW